MIWGNLLHLSFNMWSDRECPEWGLTHVAAKPYLRFDVNLWDELLGMMVEAGINMVVIDLGDGVKYDSHPEIAVDGAWTVGELKGELAKCRSMGLEPIPKLNFSTTHDAWLGPYSRCVSTDAYYKVCGDLISEVCAIFEKPRFFHIGMDEETAEHQQFYNYALIRQNELWWHDFLFLVNKVEKGRSRAWIWSDYIWNHYELFADKMPKSVLQSNWYYGDSFADDINYVKAYQQLDDLGFEQIPAGSNWSCRENFGRTVEYCRNNITSDKLLGFLQTVWRPTIPDCRDIHVQAIEIAAEAIQKACLR